LRAGSCAYPSQAAYTRPSVCCKRLPHSAVRLLQETADLSAYPDDEVRLVRIGRAIRVAFDFYHITRVLTEERVDAMAEDLRRALKGTLDDSGPTEAHRAQSQMLIGAVLAVGGLRPGAPPLGPAPTPDYVISIDGLRYGAEIKRPASAKQILTRVDEAVDQIASFPSDAGLIVLDLTDALFEPGYELDATRDEVEARFRTAYRSVSDHLERSTRPGADRIANLFVFANLYGWQRTPRVVPRSLFPTYSEVFQRARAGLIVNQSRRVRERIDEGFRVFQAQMVERRRVDWRS
jgi:hypothetical protein